MALSCHLKWLLRYKIRTDYFIRKVECPIFILHGTKDRLISFRQSEMLAQLVSHLELIALEGGGHNNLPSFPEYHEYLYDILHDDARYRNLLTALQEVA
jgi:fermentation-respiration switch protein FrsA (DUF1100 family)